MKLKCNKCGYIFIEDDDYVEIRKEPREFWGSTVYETFVDYCCPYCDSDDVDVYDERFDDVDDEDEEEDFAAFEADEDLI